MMALLPAASEEDPRGARERGDDLGQPGACCIETVIEAHLQRIRAASQSSYLLPPSPRALPAPRASVTPALG